MRKSLGLCVALIAVLVAAPLAAQSFVNGGFENGDLSGWTLGGGGWYGGWPMVPDSYLPGGTNYDHFYMVNNVVGPSIDPISGLNTVYSGNYSAKVNDAYNNDSVSVISQIVTNYTDPNIFFAWQADLQSSHGPTDSDNFTLSLTDVTKGISLYNVSYNSATAVGIFNYNAAWDWYYSPWEVESIPLPAADAGDTLILTLLASDCPYGGHAGYVYLDGFGAAPPVEGPSDTPEPSSLILLGTGVLAVAGKIRASRTHAV